MPRLRLTSPLPLTMAIVFWLCACNNPLQGAAPVQGGYGTYVALGSNAEALLYYEEVLTKLGLNPNNLSGQALVDTQRLSGMFNYLGYGALRPQDVERLPSRVLERYDLLKYAVSNPSAFQASLNSANIQDKSEIIATRYFSPKITDVADVSTGQSLPNSKIDFGWRKLVRFEPLPGSKAKANGITAAYLLFNIFQENVPRNKSAFAYNESVNTQLILERDNTPANPLLFFVYGRLSEGGKLITFLTATFDARTPSITGTDKYFVPHACADCHGGLNGGTPTSKLRLNFIDTDHIFDRLLRPDDFVDLIYTPHGALFDVGKLPGEDSDMTAPQQDAFMSIQFINSYIANQNGDVDDTDPPSFQTLMATRWNDLHKGWGDLLAGKVVSRSEKAGLFDRAIQPDKTKAVWNASDPVDADLLPMLNRYCYRCHSSLRFSVFDRGAVLNNKDNIDFYLNSKRMPQDRLLPDNVRDDMRDLVSKLK
jgi:hypothetical protein